MSSAVKQSALISLRGLLTSKPAVWLCSMGDCRTVICSDKVALAIVDGTTLLYDVRNYCMFPTHFQTLTAAWDSLNSTNVC